VQFAIQMSQPFQNGKYNLGRFRIWVTTSPVVRFGVPKAVADAVRSMKRTPEQNAVLTQHFLNQFRDYQSQKKALAVAKQSTDLHTSTLGQRAVVRLLSFFDYEAHLEVLRQGYGARAVAMLDALTEFMPPGTRWTHPEGGMFVWVELPEGLSGEALFPQAIERKVAFVPGAPFFASDPQPRTIRLNYSNRPPELIREGMRRLGGVIAEAL
jgi:aspartate/methionine/tyrosine aminotransferase